MCAAFSILTSRSTVFKDVDGKSLSKITSERIQSAKSCMRDYSNVRDPTFTPLLTNDLGLSSPLLFSAPVLVKQFRRRRGSSTRQNGSKLRECGKNCVVSGIWKYTPPSLSASFLDGGGDADGGG